MLMQPEREEFDPNSPILEGASEEEIEILKQIIEDRNNPDYSLLPDDISLDFAMTDENLYAVWYETSDRMYMINSKMGPIQLTWSLCDENPDTALSQATERLDGLRVLAVINIKNLKNLYEKATSSTSFKDKIFGKRLYFINDGNQKYWSERKENDKVLLTAKINDMYETLDYGLRILKNKNYHLVRDYRPVSDGHPDDWIYFIRNPKTTIRD